MNTHLKAPKGPYSIVLSICKACIDSDCHIIVRSARQNANAKQARLEADRAREVLRQENAISNAGVVNEGATGVATRVAAGLAAGVAAGEATGVAGEEQRDTRAPRRSRRNTRTSSPRYCFVYFTHGVYIDIMHMHYSVIY